MRGPSSVAVNDDQLCLDLLRELLAGEGYRVTTWVDGASAYPMLKRKLPDAIILDLRLATPDTGLRLLETLKLDPATNPIPVIVCSADSRLLEKLAVRLRDYCCQVLPRPFDLDDLLGMLAAVTDGSEAVSRFVSGCVDWTSLSTGAS